MPSPPEAGATLRQPRRLSTAAIDRTAFGLWAARPVGRGAEPPSEFN